MDRETFTKRLDGTLRTVDTETVGRNDPAVRLGYLVSVLSFHLDSAQRELLIDRLVSLRHAAIRSAIRANSFAHVGHALAEAEGQSV